MDESVQAVVIEDDDDVRGLIAVILAGLGLQVHDVDNGAAGIEAVSLHRPHLVVLDYGLPHMDGGEVARRIRDVSDVPILLLTAREDLVQDLPPEVTDAMAKPFTVTDLQRRAQALLQR
jgi:DNA-binding response OmpR family regulator